MEQASLAENLRVLRARRNVNISDAATAIGITRETLRDLELGTRNPYFPTLEKIAEYYSVPIQSLFVPASEEPSEDVNEAPPEELYKLRMDLEEEVERRADLLPLPQKVQEMLGQEPRTWTPEDKRNLRALIKARRAYQIAIERLETETKREPV